jgi:hypothetical protein
MFVVVRCSMPLIGEGSVKTKAVTDCFRLVKVIVGWLKKHHAYAFDRR